MSEAGDVAARTRRRATAVYPIALVAIVLGAAALAGYLTNVRYLTGPVVSFHMPMLLLALLFLGAEVALVHLHFRRGAHSFVMTEVPLVIGLFTVTPDELITAQLIALAISSVVAHRWSALKTLFNIAENAASTVLALAAFHALMPAAHGLPVHLSGHAWLATTVAVIAFMTVNSTAVAVAISVSEGSMQWQRIGFAYLMAFATAVTNLCLGLVAMSVLDADVRAAWLLAIPAVIVFLAYRAYVREREKHESLEFLYESSRIVTQAGDFEQAVVTLLTQARSMFRCEVAEALIASPDGRMLRTRVGGAGAQPVMASIADGSTQELVGLVAPSEAVAVLGAGRGSAAGTAFLAEFGLHNAMVAPLRGEKRSMGLLVIGDRVGVTATFQKADVRLLEALARHVSVALENGRLEHSLAQLREMEQQLTQLAFHDSLTGLANRSLFSEHVVTALARAKDEQRTCAVLFIDLDDFKTVNDTLGHDIGDKLLVAVAHRITACLRPSDIPARLGGDEFAVLVQDALSLQAAERIAARITDALRLPVRVDGYDLHVRSSIGIATNSDPESTTADELLRNADLAMYTAKADGKGRYRWFKSSMRADVMRRHRLKSDLEQAADRGEFQVHYQPIVDLRTGRPVAAEALVRWAHPERGLVFPSSFIPAAESSGLINEIGRFVLQNACADIASWQRSCPELPPFAVTVNLSPAQFAQPDLVAEVEDSLSDSGIDPSHLILEITEGIMLRGTERVYRILDQLKALGVRLAMDDFGTGYASLSSLRELPIDIIKIAKTFTDDISGNEEKSPFVRAIIELGEALRVTTLAEGIETAQQARELERLGCQLGQGYHFARPVAAGGIEVLLHRTFERAAYDPYANVIAFPA